MTGKAHPRLTPARPDVAARKLEGTVQAARFADPSPAIVREGRCALLRRPEGGAGMDTVLLFGEPFDIYDISDGWAWGQSGLDGYVGYVPTAALAERGGSAPTHIVATLGCQVYAMPDMKTLPRRTLPFGARVIVTSEQDDFLQIAAGGWIARPQLRALDAPSNDWVAAAEMFRGIPYVWGGRSSFGVDCSGLVQLARQAGGQDCPRDSDMQEASVGDDLSKSEPLRRGDLIFWKGHVGIMSDAETLLHANAHHMAVATEPLSGAVSRIDAAGGGDITRRARLDT